MRCRKEATKTNISPISPFPMKDSAIVIKMRPAGLAVVGELISSMNAFHERTAFAKKAITVMPAT